MPTPSLPPDYEFLDELRQDSTQRVLHARGPHGEVILRISSVAQRLPVAELEVLAALDSPGLARLVDYGTLPATEETWIARSWIPGEELGARNADRHPEEVGALLARLCPALQHLHEHGFVHADLKAENVIVTPEGRPVLTDFGLARRSGRRAEISGTLFSVAPEVLLGNPAGPAADLFALGVLLHEQLTLRAVTARDFYARFPAEPYLDAVGCALEDLPGWSRDILAELLHRDPTRRPGSAAAVEATLRARLGLPPGQVVADPRRHRIRWSPLEGREAWLESTWATAGDSGWIRLPAGEDPIELAEALRLWLTLNRRKAVLVSPSIDGQPGGRNDLDSFARRQLAGARDAVLLFPVPRASRTARQRFEHLLRTWLQLREQNAADLPARLYGISDDPEPPPESLGAPLELPAADHRTIAALLERDIEGDLDSLATELQRAAGGALTLAARMVQRGFHRGDLVHGTERHLLRPDARISRWELERSLFADDRPPRREELEVLAALSVCGGSAPLESLSHLVSASDQELAGAMSRLVRDGFARWTEEDGAPALRARGAIEERVREELGRERWSEMHAARAEELEALEDRSSEALLHGYASGPTASRLEAVLEHLARLGEQGRPDAALAFAEGLEEHARYVAPVHLARASGEVALAWAALGTLDRAEEILERISVENDPDAAVVERARGRIAHLRRDYAAAEAHLARASELDPEDNGESLFRRAMLRFERRAESELDQCLEEAAETELRESFTWNLETLGAMSRLRRGEISEARKRLEAQLAAAATAKNAEREALVRVNLATLERRTGSLDAAARHLERATRLQHENGFLPALGQGRAMLGATLRELGEGNEAEAMLRAAFELRERLGDRVGAQAVRGMLGLAHADRGRLRAALDELEASAAGLRDAGRSVDAFLLEARRMEIAARIENERPAEFRRPGEPASDPRVLLARARAEALWDEPETAIDFTRRARELARQLGLAPIEAESALLLAALSGDAGSEPVAPRPGRTAQDAAAHELLARTPDAFEAAGALETARSLASRGREDLAARLAIAVVARTDSAEMRVEARTLARDFLGIVTRGLTEAQAHRARRTLLGFPDPWPQDVEAFELSLTETADLDMDVISLLDINHRLVSQDDLPALLGEVVESAISVTRAERGFLVLEEDGELEFDTARNSRRGDIAEPELEVSRSALVRALEAGTVLRLSNAVDDPLLAGARSVALLQLRSILIAPFQVDPGLRGAIYVDHRLRADAFSDRAEKLLELLAGQAALAIRQTRRMQEIRSLNEKLERRVVEREADLATARRALRDAGAVVPANGLVGSSEAMRDVHALLDRCAASALPVLVSGESGTGKELAARALHELGPRREGPFVSENCAALPASLIEAELFGHAKGAFTGAERSRAGLFEGAHGGTLFLDEIGELPIELQAKLLRVLETGEVRRIGEAKVRSVDCRLVAATNRDLRRESAEGRFRPDLMYRLDVLQVKMPPLCDRVEDIPELVAHFLRIEEKRGGGERKASPALLNALCRRAWPGNVRELANELSRLCVLSEGDLDDPDRIRPAAPPSRGEEITDELQPLAQLERSAILRALEHTGGDKNRAAELLGISRAKIYQRLKEWASEG